MDPLVRSTRLTVPYTTEDSKSLHQLINMFLYNIHDTFLHFKTDNAQLQFVFYIKVKDILIASVNCKADESVRDKKLVFKTNYNVFDIKNDRSILDFGVIYDTDKVSTINVLKPSSFAVRLCTYGDGSTVTESRIYIILVNTMTVAEVYTIGQKLNISDIDVYYESNSTESPGGKRQVSMVIPDAKIRIKNIPSSRSSASTKAMSRMLHQNNTVHYGQSMALKKLREILDKLAIIDLEIDSSSDEENEKKLVNGIIKTVKDAETHLREMLQFRHIYLRTTSDVSNNDDVDKYINAILDRIETNIEMCDFVFVNVHGSKLMDTKTYLNESNIKIVHMCAAGVALEHLKSIIEVLGLVFPRNLDTMLDNYKSWLERFRSYLNAKTFYDFLSGKLDDEIKNSITAWRDSVIDLLQSDLSDAYLISFDEYIDSLLDNIHSIKAPESETAEPETTGKDEDVRSADSF